MILKGKAWSITLQMRLEKRVFCKHLLRQTITTAKKVKETKVAAEGVAQLSTQRKVEDERKRNGGVNRRINESMEAIKISKENSSNALFDECLENLYQMKRELDTESVEYDNSPVIEEMTKEELKITKKIFERVNKKKKPISTFSCKDIYIDPYWDPFKQVSDLKQEINFEFSEYAKMANIVELKKQRRAIKRSLKEQYKLYNPYTEEYRKHFLNDTHSEKEEDVHCSDKSERYWDPSFNKRKIFQIKSPFIWRHTHILHNFIGENGLILPRKINLTTRKQQIQIFKSICLARRMAIYPYDVKPSKDDRIPFMDPLQMLVDELTYRYTQFHNLRAQAIIKVMINKYPSLNYHKYICYEAKKEKTQAEKKQQEEEEEQGDFSRVLHKYKSKYYENSHSF